MVDVGNKLIGQFADCVSTKLSGRTAGGAELIDVTNPDEVAADVAAGEQATAASLVGTPYASSPPGRQHQPAASNEPLNVLQTAGAPVLKRVLPIILGVIALVLLRKLLHRSADSDDES